MPDSLSSLIDERSALLRQVSELGDFQPGSISSPTRRCGKPSCHCSKPDDSGHGPHYQLTQKIDGKTVSQNLPSLAAIRKAENEVAEFRRFKALTDDLVEINRKICRARPIEPAEQTTQEKNGASNPARSRPRSRTPARHYFSRPKSGWHFRSGELRDSDPRRDASCRCYGLDSTAAVRTTRRPSLDHPLSVRPGGTLQGDAHQSFSLRSRAGPDSAALLSLLSLLPRSASG
jgi:hypothetical protein